MDSAQNLNLQDPPSDYLVFLQEGQTYNLTELRQQFNTNEFALLCITDPLPFAETPFPIGSVGMRDVNYRTHVVSAMFGDTLVGFWSTIC